MIEIESGAQSLDGLNGVAISSEVLTFKDFGKEEDVIVTFHVTTNIGSAGQDTTSLNGILADGTAKIVGEGLIRQKTMPVVALQAQ